MIAIKINVFIMGYVTSFGCYVTLRHNASLYEMIYNQWVMIISYSASLSRIIVLLKTLRDIIDNLKKKSEREERSFRENGKKESFF